MVSPQHKPSSWQQKATAPMLYILSTQNPVSKLRNNQDTLNHRAEKRIKQRTKTNIITMYTHRHPMRNSVLSHSLKFRSSSKSRTPTCSLFRKHAFVKILHIREYNRQKINKQSNTTRLRYKAPHHSRVNLKRTYAHLPKYKP